MKAKVVMEFTVSNVCNPEDLKDTTFEAIVRNLIEEEGVLGIADDDSYKVISVEEVKE